MKKLLANLIGKKFSVYVGGEFERMTDFLGLIKLLTSYSDFFQYTHAEQFEYMLNTKVDKIAYIDANIYVKVGR